MYQYGTRAWLQDNGTVIYTLKNQLRKSDMNVYRKDTKLQDLSEKKGKVPKPHLSHSY